MRIVTGALGLALMTVGAVLLVTGGQLKDVALWLAGAIVLHDGIVAPLVLGVGLLLAAVPARGTVRGALIVAGCLTVVALPVAAAAGNAEEPDRAAAGLRTQLAAGARGGRGAHGGAAGGAVDQAAGAAALNSWRTHRPGRSVTVSAWA